METRAQQERAGFLEAICTEPNEDTHRLVFADWLDDHGEPEYGEFIRLQLTKGDLPYHWQYKIDKQQWRPLLGCSWVADLCLDYNRRTGQWPGYSWGSSPSPTGPGLYKCGAEEVWMAYGRLVEYGRLVKVRFRRGFVEEVALALDVFCRHAWALFRETPLLRAELFDRRPYLANGRWHWCDQHQLACLAGSDLPDDLYALCGGSHATEQAAKDALHAAALLHGRRQAWPCSRCKGCGKRRCSWCGEKKRCLALDCPLPQKNDCPDCSGTGHAVRI